LTVHAPEALVCSSLPWARLLVHLAVTAPRTRVLPGSAMPCSRERDQTMPLLVPSKTLLVPLPAYAQAQGRALCRAPIGGSRPSYAELPIPGCPPQSYRCSVSTLWRQTRPSRRGRGSCFPQRPMRCGSSNNNQGQQVCYGVRV
jgi:hypothetical protein